jgi:hypothetical protein
MPPMKRDSIDKARPEWLDGCSCSLENISEGRVRLSFELTPLGFRWHRIVVSHWYRKNRDQYKATLASILDVIFNETSFGDQDLREKVHYNLDWPAGISHDEEGLSLWTEMSNERATLWLEVFKGTPLEKDAKRLLKDL